MSPALRGHVRDCPKSKTTGYGGGGRGAARLAPAARGPRPRSRSPPRVLRDATARVGRRLPADRLAVAVGPGVGRDDLLGAREVLPRGRLAAGGRAGLLLQHLHAAP